MTNSTKDKRNKIKHVLRQTTFNWSLGWGKWQRERAYTCPLLETVIYIAYYAILSLPRNSYMELILVYKRLREVLIFLIGIK